MKKILYILLSVFIGFSCKDFNEDNFDWYKDAENPTNVANYEFAMTDADYAIIVKALRANKNHEDSTLATKLNTAKMFTTELDPAKLIPYLLADKYKAMDVNSAAKVSHLYMERDSVVARLSDKGYTLSTADYATVWGSAPLVSSLTPAKSPDAQIPNLLKKNFPNATNNSYKTVEYNYSTDEPVTTTVESVLLQETFEGYSAGSGVAVSIPGWINKDVIGSIFWQMRAYNNNYAQVSAYYKDPSPTLNEAWLIAPKVDLSEITTTSKFSFDIVTGNYNGAGLKIMISEDFDGIQANISTATWTDVTSNFTIPAPASGYSAWATAGTMNISAYNGKKIYIAFKYSGNNTSAGTKVTTTYQLDNLKVWKEVTGTDVKSKTKMYASYLYTELDKTWKKVSSSIINFQTADMVPFGITNGIMTTVLAADYLPQFLTKNYPGSEGVEKVIVYQSKAGEFYADRFKFTKGAWKLNTFIEEVVTPFAYANKDGKKQWIYDPTIIIPISKADYQLIVDYVKEHYYEGNEAVWDTRGNAEYYFGFSQYYGNISYREAGYRDKDKTYPLSGTQEEKVKFMNDRTKEAFSILLTLKYPNAVPMVNGVDQKARFDNVVIYYEPDAVTNVTWSYTFQCVGDKEWKFVSRESNDGRSEVAK